MSTPIALMILFLVLIYWISSRNNSSQGATDKLTLADKLLAKTWVGMTEQQWVQVFGPPDSIATCFDCRKLRYVDPPQTFLLNFTFIDNQMISYTYCRL